ncbi:MAG TPA: J domain-containing protein [Candidatus Limnocylindrales bacterium]|nr:J domain-containing protein [Candidatus Limnocylindrales bacterium]
MKQFVVQHLTHQAERLGQTVVYEPAGSAADLLITLPGGQQVAIYVVNYGIRSADLDEQLSTNTAQKVFSLYVLDGRMLPEENVLTEPPHWMGALHEVLEGRVYGYWCNGRAVTIRPVHFEWRWGDDRRRIVYGPPVEWGQVRPAFVHSGSNYLSGLFATADFGEGAFWKQRDPNSGRQRKYSWREWSFGQKPASAGASANADEEFKRHYGDVSGEEARFRRKQRAEREQRRQRPAAPPPAPHKHYQVLGVNHTASADEVKRAYRRMARENHPDLHPAEREKYNLRMAEINAAFEAINRERDRREE